MITKKFSCKPFYAHLGKSCRKPGKRPLWDALTGSSPSTLLVIHAHKTLAPNTKPQLKWSSPTFPNSLDQKQLEHRARSHMQPSPFLSIISITGRHDELNWVLLYLQHLLQSGLLPRNPAWPLKKQQWQENLPFTRKKPWAGPAGLKTKLTKM